MNYQSLGFDNSWYHAQPHPIIVYNLKANSFVLLCRFRTTFSISLLQLYATLLLPNGIKLFETDSLLNTGIHPRYTKVHLLSLWIRKTKFIRADTTRCRRKIQSRFISNACILFFSWQLEWLSSMNLNGVIWRCWNYWKCMLTK